MPTTTRHRYVVAGEPRDVWTVMMAGNGIDATDARRHWDVVDATFAGGDPDTDDQMRLLELLSPATELRFDLARAAGLPVDVWGPGGPDHRVAGHRELRWLTVDVDATDAVAEQVAAALRLRYPTLDVALGVAADMGDDAAHDDRD